MNVSVIVPSTEGVLVEFPGFVRDSEAAIQKLGGLTAISTAAETEAQKEAELAFNARAGDALAHPIVGDRQPTRGLILRVVTKSDSSLGVTCNNSFEVTAAARISSTFQFNSLADFQYTTSASTRQVGILRF